MNEGAPVSTAIESAPRIDSKESESRVDINQSAPRSDIDERAERINYQANEERIGTNQSEPRVDATAIVRDSTLGAWTAIGARTTFGESTLGDYSYVVGDAHVMYSEIGKFCSIAAHTRLNPGNHPLERPALHHFTYRSSAYGMGDDDTAFFDWRRSHRVVLEHDVWIGHGAVVLPGVRVGTGAVVGAGAVASKDVPPFAIAVGVPARIVRYRFDEPTAERLMRLAWWDWPHDRLAAALPDFRALGIEAFLDRYGF